ncbi:hydrogenase maturation protease [Synechocystis sp. LKSZ1]|uniref:hydrogenase maturation protease n=1 Tax=Synechocystis sp. LKSZ1 TaxID=3144951 RepID=UPI00336BE178
MVKPNLIIGYGNTLRRDDGVGYALAEEIVEKAWPEVQALAVHQLTPELAAMMAEVEQVIFIDAQGHWQAGDPLITLSSLQISGQGRSLEHHCSPGYLLALTQALYGPSPQAWLLAIAAEDFSFGEGLSEVTQQAKGLAKEQLRELLGLPDC